MGVEKEPLRDEKQFDKILEVATRTSEDARRVILLLRFTGMHISILTQSKYELHEETDNEGDIHIAWKRTKEKQKGGKKEVYTSILKSQHINFNVEQWAREVQSRKRKKSRQYFSDLIKKVGMRAGIPDLSSMTFRHTLGVDMAERGIPREIIQETLNCSDKVLKTYLKYAKSKKKDILKGVGW